MKNQLSKIAELANKAAYTQENPADYMLKSLLGKCKIYGDNLETRCQEINEALSQIDEKFDIIVANSFLHHLPDYIDTLSKVASKLNSGGQFFCFQDPLLYKSMSKINLIYSNISYYSWRIFKGDIFDGYKRFLRRKRGIFIDDSVHDNAEFHVVRYGVDQESIISFLKEHGFDCKMTQYFSTQNSLFQYFGTKCRMKNTFSIVAIKK